MTVRLQDEIKQTKPFGSTEQEAMLNVIRTAAVLNDRLDAIVRPYGITLPQYNVLRILRGAEPKALCRNDIRDRMVTRMPDMTRLLDRMESGGLVRRVREGDDRRMVSTWLTERGHALLDELDPVIDQEQKRYFGPLGEGRRRELIELLTAVRQHV